MRQDEVGIKDVAKLAGVSVGTVSNVLNKPDTVSEARRRRVERAIEKLGYVRNDAARRLKGGHSKTIGLVVVDAQNPFYGGLVSAIEEAAEERGLGVFVANSSRRASREQFHLNQFAEQRVRGTLLTPSSSDMDHARAIRDRGMRVVLVDSVVGDEGFCSVVADDHHGGYLAVRHLLELGRRRILVVGGPKQFRQIAERQSGALQAMAEFPHATLHYREAEEMTILAGRSIGHDVVDMERDERPDAIFAMNDLLATGLLQAFVMEGGIALPEEIALIGYDDIDFCESAVVPISSIRQPSHDMGAQAIRLLESEVLDGEDHDHQSVLLHPTLVARDSTIGRRT